MNGVREQIVCAALVSRRESVSSSRLVVLTQRWIYVYEGDLAFVRQIYLREQDSSVSMSVSNYNMDISNHNTDIAIGYQTGVLEIYQVDDFQKMEISIKQVIEIGEHIDIVNINQNKQEVNIIEFSLDGQFLVVVNKSNLIFVFRH